MLRLETEESVVAEGAVEKRAYKCLLLLISNVLVSSLHSWGTCALEEEDEHLLILISLIYLVLNLFSNALSSTHQSGMVLFV